MKRIETRSCIAQLNVLVVVMGVTPGTNAELTVATNVTGLVQ